LLRRRRSSSVQRVFEEGGLNASLGQVPGKQKVPAPKAVITRCGELDDDGRWAPLRRCVRFNNPNPTSARLGRQERTTGRCEFSGTAHNGVRSEAELQRSRRRCCTPLNRIEPLAMAPQAAIGRRTPPASEKCEASEPAAKAVENAIPHARACRAAGRRRTVRVDLSGRVKLRPVAGAGRLFFLFLPHVRTSISPGLGSSQRGDPSRREDCAGRRHKA
jgi:hypothetical protein